MKKFALLAATLALAATSAFAGEMVSVNPVTNKPLSIRGYATPLYMVGSYDKDGKADFAIIDRGGVVMSHPDRFGLGIKKTRATAANIMESKAFTVVIPSGKDASLLAQFDFMGSHSHAKNPEMDKVKEAGMNIAKSDVVNAPVATDFPLVFHCKLTDVLENEGMYFFIGDVEKVEADKSLFDAEGHMNLSNVLYQNHQYILPGESLGKPGELFKK